MYRLGPQNMAINTTIGKTLYYSGGLLAFLGLSSLIFGASEQLIQSMVVGGFGLMIVGKVVVS